MGLCSLFLVDVNASFTVTDSTSGEKVNNGTVHLSSSVGQMVLAGIDRALPSADEECLFFSSTLTGSSRINHKQVIEQSRVIVKVLNHSVYLFWQQCMKGRIE